MKRRMKPHKYDLKFPPLLMHWSPAKLEDSSNPSTTTDFWRRSLMDVAMRLDIFTKLPIKKDRVSLLGTNLWGGNLGFSKQ